MIAYAAGAEVARSFLGKINDIILFPFITLLLAVALVVFLYGCFELIMNAADSGARTKGKDHVLYGFIGMVVMVSALAILKIAAGTFGLDVPAQ